MKQGEIWFADLNPVAGSEQAGLRPVVIISGNLLNEHLAVVVVAPLITKVKNYKGNPVLKPNAQNGLKAESEILVFHIRSISKSRLINRIGNTDSATIGQTIKTLNDILKY